jgi:hypothetical protein
LKQPSKQKIKGPNDVVSNRSRSKVVDHIDQNFGDGNSTRLQAICNSALKGVFFSLCDLKVKGISKV